MSLTGPSRTGIVSVVLLVLCALFLGLILASMDWSQKSTRDLVGAISDLKDQQKRDAAALRAEVEAMRQGLERRLSTLRVTAGTSDGEADPPLPRRDLAMAGAKKRPIGGMYVTRAEEPSTLNRWVTNEGRVRSILQYVHEPLFDLDPETVKPRPALATSWEVSDDKMRYRFRLRKGVTFSDGSAFTAKDVAYTLALIQDPNVKSDLYKPEFEDVTRCEIVNDHEIVFHLKKKYWRGIYALGLSLRVMSASWVRSALERIAAADRETYPEGSYSVEPGGKRFGDLYNSLKMPGAGTGPYRFDEKRSWVKDSHLTIYRWPGSWWFRERPGKWNLAAMRWRFIDDPTVLWEEVKKRKIDINVVNNDKWFSSFSKDPLITDNFEMHLFDHTGLGHSFICWNTRKTQFQDARVRNSMTHLVDRKTMLDVFQHGIGDIATCIFKRWYPEYSFDLEPKLLDVRKARQLLAEAGWKDSNGDGILDKDGQDFRFQMSIPTGNKDLMLYAQLWQKDMKRAGVEMKIKPSEWASFISAYYERDFDACALFESHTDPWIEAYEAYLPTQTQAKGANHSGWTDPEVAKILTEARTEFDAEKRRAIFHRFNKLRYDAQPRTLLIHGKVIVVVAKRFKGVKIQKRGAWQEDWYVPTAEQQYDENGFGIR